MIQVKRDPAMLLALFAALVQFASAFVVTLSIEQQSLLNAVAVAIVGVVTALAVKGDRLLAAIVGLAQAVIALGAGFGLALLPEQQGAAMALISIVGAMWLRTQLVAPVPSLETRPMLTASARPGDPAV